MKTHKTLTPVVFLAINLILLFGTGCTGLQSYRTEKVIARASDEITTNPLKRLGENYVLSIIEFDDQGEMWDRTQLDNAIDELKGLRTNGHPVSLVIFTHGWRNNAASHNTNLSDFHKFIETIGVNDEAIPDSVPNRPKGKKVVFGVYLAWRGDGIGGVASFYGRKNTAARVAGISCTEAILSLTAIARMNYPGNDSKFSKVAIIGHSFGGLIVERAVSQAMLGGMLINAPFDESARRQATNLLPDIVQASNNVSQLEGKVKDNNFADDLKKREPYVIQRSGDLTALKNARDEKSRLQTAFAPLNNVRVRAESEYKGTLLNWDEITKWEIEQFGPNRSGLLAELQKELLETLPDSYVETFLGAGTNIVEILDRRQKFKTIHALMPRTLAESDVPQRVLQRAAAELSTYANIYATIMKSNNITDTRSLQLLGELVKWANHFSRLTTLKNIVEYSSDHDAWVSANRRLSGTNGIINQLEGGYEAQRKAAGEKFDEAHKRWVSDTIALNSERGRLAGLRSRQENQLINVSRPPADLVLLVNPASEALIAKQMVDALERNKLIGLKSLATNTATPWLISVSSKKDHATRFAFPFGRSFPSVVEAFRSYETNAIDSHYTRYTPGRQASYGGGKAMQAGSGSLVYGPYQGGFYRSTATHHPLLVNHKIMPVDSSEALPKVAKGEEVSTAVKTNLSRAHFVNCPHQFIGTKSRYAVTRWESDDSLNHSSYWIVEADPEVIKKHGNIFTPDGCAMMIGFFRMSQMLHRGE